MTCMNCGGPLTGGVKFCPRCGTPAAQPDPFRQQQYTPPGGQMYSSFDPGAQQQRGAPPRRKSRAGKILLIIFGVILVLAAGAMAAAYFGYRYIEGTLKNSEPYQLAVEDLKSNPVAAEHFGEIRDTGFPLGNFNEDGATGRAEFTISVEGEKGSGRYMVTMSMTGGAWRITNSVIKTPGGKLVNLTSKPVVVGNRSAPGDGEADEAGAATDDVPTGDPPTDDAPTDDPSARPTPLVNLPPLQKKNVTISGGVLNGKTLSKPAPPYPALARSARASGTVTVQVTVDEQGRVTSAQAVSGHPLLRAAAEAAARQARLTPTLLSGTPVKVTGVLTYNFQPE